MQLEQQLLRIKPNHAPEYDVLLRGDWSELAGRIRDLRASQVFLIGQQGLEEFVLSGLLPALAEFFPDGLDSERVILIEGGERNKHWSQAGSVYNRLIEAGIDRKALILAAGGGVVGDFAGFIAATVLRGVAFVQLPSTLLAAVDSSVGGKVAVNVDRGKNMVGAFYPPRLVYCNASLFRTLPEREWVCGLAEMAKHAFLDETGRILPDLEARAGVLRDPDAGDFRAAVLDSVGFKARVVEQDERESGIRASLNLGHTTGHAIESLTNYTRFAHGEAVSRGLVTALLLSRSRSALPQADFDRMLGLLRALELPVDTAGLNGEEVWEHVRFDKKNVGGKPAYVLLAASGQVRLGEQVDRQEFLDAWAEQEKL